MVVQKSGVPGRLLLLVTTALALVAPPAFAQYFGRNKVNYEKFDFQVVSTEHFDLHFYPRENQAAMDAARMAERWYERLSPTFGQEFKKKKPLILYSDHADFQQTNTTSGFLGQGTGGFTEPVRNRVVMPLTGDYAGTDHVLGHELVHVFQFDIAFGDEDSTMEFRLNLLPLWLIEGMAEYLSVGREDPHTAMWLRDALLQEEFPTMKQLTTDPRFFPYRYGQAVWAYVGGKWGDDKIADIYRASGKRGMEYAFAKVLGVTTDSLSGMWADAVKEAYLPAMEGRDKPKEAGKRILADDIDSGDINLSPVLSPDGQKVAFLSERDLFSIDVFIADANTGKVGKKLLSAATNGHFDALRFIDSAGTWSPDGKRFAVVVFAKGNNEILVLNTDSGKILKRFQPENVGAISNPAWSPDGKQITFSGSAQGSSDLYHVDVTTGELTRLTDDRYADLQPSWSPDGNYLAFVTDRGPGTDFEELRYAPMRIGIMDIATRDVRILAPLGAAKHINPQFSPDGKSLYFISDREGFSDVYRMALETGEVFQVTRVATGVSGITALSPAMTVAPSTGRLLFTVFEDGKYIAYGLEQEEAQGKPWAGSFESLADLPPGRSPAGLLPPAEDQGKVFVADYLADPVGGLPDEEDFIVAKYKSHLQLDYVGAFPAGVVVDRFGTAIGGGATAYFSDMLGNRTVGVGLQARGGLKDVGAQGFYLNRDQRWHWGAVAGHLPYLNFFTTISSGDTIVVSEVRERIFLDRASLFTSYPFSGTKRVETSLGFTRYSFDLEVQELRYEGNGRFIGTEKIDLNARPAINLAQASLAFVGDNTIFGFTSPIQGERFRLEIEPSVGTITYQTVIVDYRRYLRVSPFTLAARGFHVGRYGSGSDEERLSPLYVGYATLVRGYSVGSFDGFRDCPQGVDDCPQFDRLLGSRIGVMNLEMRFPFIGTSQFGLINFPYLPTELSLFFDGGVAWEKDNPPEIRFVTRQSDLDTTTRYPVFSAGASARVNILGALVLEGYVALPFQRSAKESVFGLQIAPGW